MALAIILRYRQTFVGNLAQFGFLSGSANLTQSAFYPRAPILFRRFGFLRVTFDPIPNK
jgi:hypothetical protein